MRWTQTLVLQLRSLIHRKTVESELDEEVRFHVERQIAEQMAAGATPEAARRSALLEFGGVEQFKEQCRDTRRVSRIENLAADLRYAFRGLRKSPGFTFICILTLALGIGANTAVFSMVNALMLHPYNFPNLDRIVNVWEDRGIDSDYDARYIAPPDAEDLRKNSSVFESFALLRSQNFSLGVPGDVQSVYGCRVSANFLEVLGIAPALGRFFTASEEQPGSPQSAVISHRFWRRQFGGDPRILGQTLLVNGLPYTIVGIMPKGSEYPVSAQLWVPLALTPEEKSDRTQLSTFSLARLKPGVSIAQARTEIANLAHRLGQDYPKTNSGRTATLLELRKELYLFTLPLFSMLQFAAGFVLLLACANLANLFFARMIGRQKEIALRAALGAGRGRLAQLFIVETMLLSISAGFAAIVASFASVRALRTSIPSDWTQYVAGWDRIQVDRSVLGFAILVAMGVGLFFGIAVMLHTSKVDLNKTLKESGQSSMSLAKGKLRTALVVVQVVFALVLLVCAGLTIQGFMRLVAVYQGFEPANVLDMEFSLPKEAYKDTTKVRDFYERLLRESSVLSGVQHASLISNPPASNVDNDTTYFTIEGRPALKTNETPSADLQFASPDLFDTLKVPLISGRVFTVTDNADSPRVAVISRGTATRFWPKGDAVGQRIKLGPQDSTAPWLTIIGVVGDVRLNWWNPLTRPAVYQSPLQSPQNTMTFLLRTNGNPTGYAGGIREIVQEMDPGVAPLSVSTLQNEVASSIGIVRIMGILMGIFGFVAVVLSSVGVYGVLSESVAQRHRELGIRLALGANPRDLMNLVLRRSMKLTGVGLLIALPISLAIGQAMATFVLGIVTLDFGVLGGFMAVLMAVAVCAGFIPARRAMRVDPHVSLRYE